MLTLSEIQICDDANISMFLQLQCKTYKVFVFTHLSSQEGGRRGRTWKSQVTTAKRLTVTGIDEIYHLSIAYNIQ